MTRLYNKYGAAQGEHADVINGIISGAMRRVEEYVGIHDICPRDATGHCTMIASSALAGYTIRRGMRIKDAERKLEKETHASNQ